MKNRSQRPLILAAVLGLTAALGFLRFHQTGHPVNTLAVLRGGAGTVDLGDSRNQLQWRSGSAVLHWVGKPAEDSEAIYFDGRKVYPFSWTRTLAMKGFIVRFRPDRIDVYDLGHWAGESFPARGH